MCLTQALVFAEPEDVLSQLPTVEGKVSDTNYLVRASAKACPGGYQPASWLSYSCVTAQSRVSAVKTVTLIILKIPVYLDSQESQHGKTHITACF